MVIQPASIAAVLVALAACVFDLRTRRIPNSLTFGSAIAAFAFHLAISGPAGLAWSAGGWAVGIAIFLPVFMLRGLGAGDVKLLAALGAWAGPVAVLWAGLYGALAGGILAIVLILARGYLRPALSNIGRMFTYWRAAGLGPVPTLTLADARGPRLPYAVPIAVGLVAALWLR